MEYDFQFGEVLGSFDELLYGAWITLCLSAASMILGLALAIAFALGRTAGPVLLRRAITVYVEAVRNTPFLVQIYLIFFGLPSIGLRLDPNQAGLLAMTINISAYSTEIVRSGIESITRGQIDAGKALGLRSLHIFWLIILPPALRTVYPALTSQFMLMLLSSSVLSAIGTEELTAVANNIESRTFRSIEVYLVAALMYFAISTSLAFVFRVIHRQSFRSSAAW